MKHGVTPVFSTAPALRRQLLDHLQVAQIPRAFVYDSSFVDTIRTFKTFDAWPTPRHHEMPPVPRHRFKGITLPGDYCSRNGIAKSDAASTRLGVSSDTARTSRTRRRAAARSKRVTFTHCDS